MNGSAATSARPARPRPGTRWAARRGVGRRSAGDRAGARLVARPSPRAELEVGVPAVQDDEIRFVARLGKPEPDARMRGAEAAGQVGDEPGAQRLLEG